ncbi:recombinase family protein [Ruthenibacterium sp. CLA-JM-H11]|uniref:Recombinase family protein n=1 Tax=Ruthenibacterium intestinale TaxID=3133163 RepID=A0ABV1GHC3_9FIRM
MAKSKMRAAAYCRVSTSKEEQLDSYSAQQDFFKEYCQHHNFDLLRIYGDEGKSGTKMKNRKQLLELLSDAERGLYDVVLIKDPSRLARNTIDFLTAVRKLKACGIQVIFVNYDLTSSESNEFTLTIMSAIAQEESANMSRRVKFGKRLNAEKGRVPNIVYGYDKTKGDYFHLSVNEQEAQVVREIFELYANKTMGASLIARELNRRGLKTKRGCDFNSNGIVTIIKNPIYIGKIVNGRQRVEDFLTGTRVDTPPEEWLITENPDLRIISDELFSRAQQAHADARKQYPHPHTHNVGAYKFSGLIRCKCCGYHFTRYTRTYKNTYVRWCCANKNLPGGKLCPNRTHLKEDELEQAIRNYLSSFLSEQKDLQKLMAEEFERVIRQNSAGEYTVDSIQKALSKLSREKDKLIELFNNDIITLDEMKVRASSINSEIAEWERRKQSSAAVFDPNELHKQIASLFGDIRSVLLNNSFDNRLLKQLIDEIIVDEAGQIEIKFRALKELPPFSMALYEPAE